MLWGVVCLMMVPYPQLVERSGGSFERIIVVTAVVTLVAVVAGVAAWLLTRRHTLRWPGQAALAVALAGLIWFAWSLT